MYIYYPSDATVLVRQVNGGVMTEQFISYGPDQVIIITDQNTSASTAFLTASFATNAATASYLCGGASVSTVIQTGMFL
jgi:hypothetical protein